MALGVEITIGDCGTGCCTMADLQQILVEQTALAATSGPTTPTRVAPRRVPRLAS
jgi:hypothetical protein